MEKRLMILAISLILGYTCVMANLSAKMQNSQLLETAIHQSQLTMKVGQADGTIYDRNFVPLVNQDTAFYASVIPTFQSVAELMPHIEEMNPVLEGLQNGEPFVCRVDTDDFDCPEITVLEIPQRQNSSSLAQHIIGYTRDHEGVTGLEADYNKILRSLPDTATVTYTTDALGQILMGEEPVISPIAYKNAGVVTTLDSRIQAICENMDIPKGAIVVMDVESGDILAMTSFPSYDSNHLADALDNPESPFLNRCLSAYNVGSIFKLMTCATAYKLNMTNFLTNCTGKTKIKNQVFRCHDWRGHDIVDMKHAMIYSCNVFFVDLSQYLDPRIMLETAQSFGFGSQIALTKSLISSSGSLPDIDDLSLPAEMANFCFGQGLLTATPLQITQMTCGIANDGNMPLARLIKGYTLDNQTVENEKNPIYAKSLPKNAAYYLQNLMIAAINESDTSNAVPDTVFAGAKTSTAQTGRYDEEDIELCHAWITGFFPIHQPKYAVTVFVEDGGYGNDAAAPIFKQIADEITALPD